MRILFLPHRLPFPPNKGDKIRSYHLLKYLLERHEVYLGTFVDQERDWDYVPQVRALVEGRCFIAGQRPFHRWARAAKALLTGTSISASCFLDAGLRQWTQSLLASGQIDQVVIFSTAMAPYGFDRTARANVILDMVDVDSDKWAQYAAASKGLKRWLYRREAKALGSLEQRATRLFSATVLVSDFEAGTLARAIPGQETKIFAAPNGVNLTYFCANPGMQSPYPARIRPIVMTGQMDYRPNWEGAVWFVGEVLEQVLRYQPDAHFFVVGADPPPQLKRLEGAHVTVTGTVPDVRPYLRFASVAVAPLHLARGVQNKVLEAMAMGKPVVCTTAATRALNLKSGRELLIADSPFDFATAVVSGLDPHQAERLGPNARAHVECFYNWERNLSLFDALMERDRIGNDSRAEERISNGRKAG